MSFGIFEVFLCLHFCSQGVGGSEVCFCSMLLCPLVADSCFCQLLHCFLNPSIWIDGAGRALFVLRDEVHVVRMFGFRGCKRCQGAETFELGCCLLVFL